MFYTILCWLFAWLVPAIGFAGALSGLVLLVAVLLGWIPCRLPWKH